MPARPGGEHRRVAGQRARRARRWTPARPPRSRPPRRRRCRARGGTRPRTTSGGNVNTVTSASSRRSSSAVRRPTGPTPMTAASLPFSSTASRTARHGRRRGRVGAVGVEHDRRLERVEEELLRGLEHRLAVAHLRPADPERRVREAPWDRAGTSRPARRRRGSSAVTRRSPARRPPRRRRRRSRRTGSGERRCPAGSGSSSSTGPLVGVRESSGGPSPAGPPGGSSCAARGRSSPSSAPCRDRRRARDRRRRAARTRDTCWSRARSVAVECVQPLGVGEQAVVGVGDLALHRAQLVLGGRAHRLVLARDQARSRCASAAVPGAARGA